MRDCGPTEVGGFAISAADDLLLVEDVQMVRQHCTPCTVAFVDEAVADFFDRQIDLELKPERFSRIWVHTHPGNCPLPSGTDEETFARVFGQTEWAVMFILARGGRSFARLRFNVGPGGEIEIPVGVDYTRPFVGSDWETWQKEYDANLVDIDRLLREVPAPQKESTEPRSSTLRSSILRSSIVRELPHPEDPFFDPLRFEELEELDLLSRGYFYE